ncbi:GerAB/ArcD/ProY family transporter [Clostridium manihotivorum]|uniref:GerAB/ArcD/ProY family transporter n=1 Tax=Clostridium manihotivorum TaxID=2320868 RepID=UPI0013E29B5C|nr:GerAB/ArcD/ProY family transporter [Clostridium manihotivorum]
MSDGKISLTISELSQILIASLVGVGILYIPNSIIKYAEQDSWIGCIFGAIYPFYMLFIASYIAKMHPDENILVLSRRYFGNVFGSILNILYTFFFIFLLTSEIDGFKNVSIVYLTNFISGYKAVAVIVLSAAYATYKGLKPLARVSEIIFFTTSILVLLLAGSLVKGSIYNIQPVFRTSIVKLAKASKETAFFYSGVEAVFLYHPFLKEKSKLLKYCSMCVGYIAFTYIMVVFLTIYYLGIDISPKYLWPVITLTDVINIPIINSFRYIFLALWSFIILKCIAIYYYSSCFCINQIVNKISIHKITILIYPIIVYVAVKYGNETTRREVSGIIMPICAYFNIFFVTIMAIGIKRKSEN